MHPVDRARIARRQGYCRGTGKLAVRVSLGAHGKFVGVCGHCERLLKLRPPLLHLPAHKPEVPARGQKRGRR